MVEQLTDQDVDPQVGQSPLDLGINKKALADPDTLDHVTNMIQQATELKEKGNQHFKSGEYKQAALCYKRIFLYINGLAGSQENRHLATQLGMSEQLERFGQRPISEESGAKVFELKVTCNANLAMVYLKMGKPDQALKYSDQALAYDPQHTKALYRKGQALLAMGKLDKAKACLTAAAKAEPNNLAIRRELRQLSVQLTEQSAKSRAELGARLRRSPTQPAKDAPLLSVWGNTDSTPGTSAGLQSDTPAEEAAES